MKKIIALFFTCILSYSNAAETNNFKNRKEMLSDKAQGLKNLYLINDKVNVEIQRVVQMTNDAIKEDNYSCAKDYHRKPPKIMKRLEMALGGVVDTKIEEYISDNEMIKKTPYRDSWSLFEDTLYNRFWESWGMSDSLNVNGYIIGSDKLGHFFGSSLKPYTYAFKHFNNPKIAYEKSNEREDGIEGLKASKVKSYGDITANIAGVKFWNNFISFKDDATESYVKCDAKTGLYEVNRDFDFSNYINDLWDEGLNCNVFSQTPYPYKSSKMKNLKVRDIKVKENYESYLSKKNLVCPVDKDFCKRQAQKKCSIYYLSPVCFEKFNLIANEACNKREDFKVKSTNKSSYRFNRENKSKKGTSQVIFK